MRIVIYLTVCLSLSVAVQGSNSGIFGTRIRSAADFASYIPELTAERARIFDSLVVHPPATTVAEALRDAKALMAVNEFCSVVLNLKHVLDVYESSHPEFAQPGQAVLDATQLLRRQLATDSDVTTRVDAALKVLRTRRDVLKISLARAAGDTSADTSASSDHLSSADQTVPSDSPVDAEIAEIELALFQVTEVSRWFREITGSKTIVNLPQTPLDEVVGWENSADVRAIRALWRNTAGLVAAKFGKRKYISEVKLDDIKTSLTQVIECAALALKSFLGVTLRLDQHAFEVDEYSFTFNAVQNDEIIGVIHLHAVTDQWARVSFLPRLIGGHLRSAMSVGELHLASESSQSTHSAPSISVSKAEMLERLEILRSDEFDSIFNKICSDVSRFLEMKHEDPLMWLEASSSLNRHLGATVFGLWGRDFKDAIGGVAVDATPKLRRSAGGCYWMGFFGTLESVASIVVESSTQQYGSKGLARVLGTTTDHILLQRVGNFRKSQWPWNEFLNRNSYLHSPLAAALAVTVYARDEHRKTIYELYNKSKEFSLGSLKRLDGSSAAFSIDFPPSEGEKGLSTFAHSDGLREFLLPNLRPGVVRSMKQLFPQLSGASNTEILESTNIEELIDWNALLQELVSQADF